MPRSRAKELQNTFSENRPPEPLWDRQASQCYCWLSPLGLAAATTPIGSYDRVQANNTAAPSAVVERNHVRLKSSSSSSSRKPGLCLLNACYTALSDQRFKSYSGFLHQVSRFKVAAWISWNKTSNFAIRPSRFTRRCRKTATVPLRYWGSPADALSIEHPCITLAQGKAGWNRQAALCYSRATVIPRVFPQNLSTCWTRREKFPALGRKRTTDAYCLLAPFSHTKTSHRTAPLIVPASLPILSKYHQESLLTGKTGREAHSIKHTVTCACMQ